MSDKSRADSSSIDAATTICAEKINSRSNSEEGLNSNEENNESMENNSDGASVKQDELVANNSLGSEALNSTDNVAIDQTAPNDVKCELSNGQNTVLNGSASAVDTNTNKFASEENLYQELIEYIKTQINKHLSELNKSREEYEKTTRLLVERAQEKFPDYSKHKVVKYIKSTMNEFSIKYNSNSIDYLIKQDKFKSKAKTDMVNSASQRSDESANDNNGRDSNTPITSQQQQPDSNYLPPSSASPSPSPLKNQLKTSTSSSSLSNKNVSFTTSSSSMEQQPQRLNSNSPKLAYNSIPSPSSVSSSTSNNNNKHSSSQSDSLKNSKKFKSNAGSGPLSSSPSPSLSKSSDTSKMNDSQKSPHGLNAMSFFGNNPAAAAAFEAAAKFNPFAAGLSSSSSGIPGLPPSASSTNPLASYLAGMTPTPGSGATGPSSTAPFLDPDFLRFANPLFRFPDFNPAAATAGNPYLNSLNHLFRSNLAAAAAFGGQLPFGAPPSVSSSSTSASSSSSSSSSSSNPSSFMPPSSTLSMQPSSSSSFSPASSSNSPFTSSILNQSKTGSSFNPPVSSSSSSSSYDHKPNDSFGYLNGSSSLDPTSLSSPLLSSSSSSSSSSSKFQQQQPNKSTLNNSSGSQQSKQSNLTNASSKSANNKPSSTSVTSNGDSYGNKSHSNSNANSQNQLSSLSLFNSSIKFKLNGKFSKLTHTELQSMKNLITSYRESAAFLCRSADELEGILSECSSSSTNTGSNNPTTPNSHHSSLMNHHSSHHASHHHHPHHHLE